MQWQWQWGRCLSFTARFSWCTELKRDSEQSSIFYQKILFLRQTSLTIPILRRTNLTSSEVTKLLTAYSTTMVPLILTFQSQIVLFVTWNAFILFIIQWLFSKPIYQTQSLWIRSKLLIVWTRKASLRRRWTEGSSSSSLWTTSRSLRASSWTGIFHVWLWEIYYSMWH